MFSHNYLQRFLVLGAVLHLSIPVLAVQQKEFSSRHVTIETARANRSEVGAWKLALTGTTIAPEGTEILFQVTWNSVVIETFKLKTKGESFNKSWAMKNASKLLGKTLQVRTVIKSEDQSAAVKKRLRAAPQLFPDHADPWTDYHFDKSFSVGSAKEIEEQKEKIKTYFQERMTELLQIDGAVKEKVESYSAEGAKFDAAEWQKWFQKEAVTELAEIQEGLSAAMQDLRFRAYWIALSNMQEIAGGVVRRVLKKQKVLFSDKNIALSKELEHPGELDETTRIRAVPNGRYLNVQWKEIAKQLGITPAKEN